MAKYVYVVTRLIEGSQKGIQHIPNLGVHSNEKKARRHYESILKDRHSLGCSVRHNTVLRSDERPVALIGEARVGYESARYDQGLVEQLRLEKWRISEGHHRRKQKRSSV